MQHPPRERPGTGARLASLLLLGLAVAACGGGGDQTRQAGDTAQVRTAAAGGAAQSQQAGPQCPPPPAIDPTFFTDSTWASLTTWRVQHNVRFAGRQATAQVPLERNGPAVSITIRSENSTHCLSRDSAADRTRIAGVYRVDAAISAFGHNFSAGDSILVFSHDTSGSAVLAFEGTDGRVRTAPENTWNFYFCHDGHSHPDPEAEWRPFDPPGPPQGGEDPGTYGWMACASGCCQFYIPPNPGEEDGGGAGGPPGGTMPFCDRKP